MRRRWVIACKMRRVNFQNGIRNLGGGSGAAVLTFEIGSTAEATLDGDQGEDLSKGRVDGHPLTTAKNSLQHGNLGVTESLWFQTPDQSRSSKSEPFGKSLLWQRNRRFQIVGPLPMDDSGPNLDCSFPKSTRQHFHRIPNRRGLLFQLHDRKLNLPDRSAKL